MKGTRARVEGLGLKDLGISELDVRYSAIVNLYAVIVDVVVMGFVGLWL